MAIKDIDEKRKLFDEFQKIWTLERVKGMTLEEYTNLKTEGEYFTYWIEHKLETLGDIGGGAAFKFGIFKR